MPSLLIIVQLALSGGVALNYRYVVDCSIIARPVASCHYLHNGEMATGTEAAFESTFSE